MKSKRRINVAREISRHLLRRAVIGYSLVTNNKSCLVRIWIRVASLAQKEPNFSILASFDFVWLLKILFGFFLIFGSFWLLFKVVKKSDLIWRYNQASISKVSYFLFIINSTGITFDQSVADQPFTVFKDVRYFLFYIYLFIEVTFDIKINWSECFKGYISLNY